jgi:hypothetical protein
MNDKKDIGKAFNDKVKEALMVIGFILSVLGAVGYLATILVLVMGTKRVHFELMGKDGVFFIIGLAFGLVIRSGFYIQGVTYAKREYKTVLDEYYAKKVVDKKEKRSQSFEYKMAMEITRTTMIQVVIFIVSGMGLIYLAGFDGMNNFVYVGNAISNLFMFTGFGFLALNSSYEKYIMLKIPRIKEDIRLLDLEEVKKKEDKEIVKAHEEDIEHTHEKVEEKLMLSSPYMQGL